MTALPPFDMDQIVADRRHLHAHPELAYEEFETAAYVARRLESLGYDVKTGVGKTGVTGTTGSGDRCVLLRADMDALPIQEENSFDFRSTADGKMHACGHDGHVAAGLATARRLAETDLPGSVKFAFQPAEEGGRGAEAMIHDGAMEAPTVHAAFGMHLWSYLPTGKIAVTPGPSFASADSFSITVKGVGGHAATPDQTIDPVVIAAHIITALQSIVSRRRDPLEEAVVTVTTVHAGEAFNVIPDTATLGGTVRTYGGEIHANVPTLMTEIATGIGKAMGAEVDVQYDRMLPPTVNDPEMAALMARVAADIVGEENVLHTERTMGGEDMAFFLDAVPGCYAFVGMGNAEVGSHHPHHSPHFTIDEAALPIAADLLSRTALTWLAS